MKELNPQDVWTMFHLGEEPAMKWPFQLYDDDDQTIDYSMKYMLKAHGWSLKSVVVHSACRHYRHCKNIDYLQADCVIADPDGDEYRISFLPDYEGSTSQWLFLQDNVSCDDLIISFFTGVAIYDVEDRQPHWRAVVVDKHDIILHGKYIYWDMLEEDEFQYHGPGWDTSISSKEMYDLTQDTVDSDYDKENNPYNNWTY